MTKMSTHDLTARINRFMDRKVSRMVDVSELSGRKTYRSHNQHIEVSAAPFIALAIK